MARNNQNKTISCNSYGMIISYGDANKHQFVNYQSRNAHVSKIQTEGTVKYQKIEKEIKFTPKQKDLYSKVVYGFKAYTKEEIAKMSEQTKIDVTIRYTKVQRFLNRWKQDITFSAVDQFLMFLFPKSPIVKQMVNTKGYIDDSENELSFSDLGIDKDKIASKLVENGFLPKNFFNLV